MFNKETNQFVTKSIKDTYVDGARIIYNATAIVNYEDIDDTDYHTIFSKDMVELLSLEGVKKVKVPQEVTMCYNVKTDDGDCLRWFSDYTAKKINDTNFEGTCMVNNWSFYNNNISNDPTYNGFISLLKKKPVSGITPENDYIYTYKHDLDFLAFITKTPCMSADNLVELGTHESSYFTKDYSDVHHLLKQVEHFRYDYVRHEINLSKITSSLLSGIPMFKQLADNTFDEFLHYLDCQVDCVFSLFDPKINHSVNTFATFDINQTVFETHTRKNNQNNYGFTLY